MSTISYAMKVVRRTVITSVCVIVLVAAALAILLADAVPKAAQAQSVGSAVWCGTN